MEFVRIFDDQDSLLTVKYDGQDEDEFTKIFDQWTDIEYLDNFFTTNEVDLNRPFWEEVTVEQAIIETRREALKFREHLKRISLRPENERISLFKRLFKPLSPAEVDLPFWNKKKIYGLRKKTWLRLYAIKIGDDMFIVTGGTIKLTDNMEERTHTKDELRKLESCRDYLKTLGTSDEESIIELIEL